MPDISDNDFNAPTAELVAGGDLAIKSPYAPDASLYLGREASWNPTAQTVATRGAKVFESGSAGKNYIESGSAGRDYVGLIVGNGSTVYNQAPNQIWGLLESIVNAGIDYTGQAIAAYDRIAFAPDAAAVADEYTASDAVSDENATTESDSDSAKVDLATLTPGFLKIGSGILIAVSLWKLWKD